MTIYAAYGSNINLDQMKFRCPNAKLIGDAFLKNYKLIFTGENIGYANVKQCTGSQVLVLLWELDEEDEEALDMYEHVPDLYYKDSVIVEKDNKEIKTMIYIMPDKYTNNVIRPSKRYIEIIKKGYIQNNLNLCFLYDAYLDCIESLYGKKNG